MDATTPLIASVRRVRIIWRLAMVGVLASALLSTSASATSNPPELLSSVVVTGSTTAYVEVRLTRPLSIAEATAPSVKVTGTGFVGLALIRVQPGIAPPGLVVSKLAGTNLFHYAWVGHQRGTFADDDPPTFFTRTLPPGRYRLYLLTSGTTSASWTLPLRTGRTTFAPRTRTPVAVTSSVSPGSRSTLVASAYSEQTTATVAHRALALGQSWYDSHGNVEATLGGCTYPGDASLLGLGPAPACLDRDASTGPVGPALNDRLVSQSTAFITPGKWTSKSYVRVSGLVRDGGISILILDLGEGFPA